MADTARCQACRTTVTLDKLRPLTPSTVDGADLGSVLSPDKQYVCDDHGGCLARVHANQETAWREPTLYLVAHLPEGRPGTICLVTTDELDAHNYAQSLPGAVAELPMPVDYRPRHRKKDRP